MSKRSKKKRAGAHDEKPLSLRRHARSKFAVGALVVLCVCALLAASFAATYINPVRHAVGLQPLTAAALTPTTPTPLSLSKEYIYAGGRLVATEGPLPPRHPQMLHLISRSTNRIPKPRNSVGRIIPATKAASRSSLRNHFGPSSGKR